MKPVKRGIKVWALPDSHNGYFHNFHVYTSKEGSGEKQLDQSCEGSNAAPERENHHACFDDLFTSEELLCDLAEDIFVYGMVRKDRRGFSPALKTAKLNNKSV